MPTAINANLISWASDIDPGTIRQAEQASRLPIVDGHVARQPRAAPVPDREGHPCRCRQGPQSGGPQGRGLHTLRQVLNYKGT
jgi:hypothetical protein